MSNNLLYHGSIYEIISPADGNTKSPTTDFGDGFYLTEIREQAEAWARRKYKSLRKYYPNAKAIVNVYELDRERVINDFKYKFFPTTTDEWLDFIKDCRNNEEHYFDIVEGPMADDQIYFFVNDYLTGRITREQFWEKALFNKYTHQVMIRNDALRCLKFINSYEVDIDE